MKRLLLVDAVESAERASHPLGSVEQWFGCHLKPQHDLAVQTLPASALGLASASSAADGVIISGSPRDAWADSPDVRQMLKFLQTLISRSQPILGVCFGHQLLGRALGADVQRNPAGWE